MPQSNTIAKHISNLSHGWAVIFRDFFAVTVTPFYESLWEKKPGKLVNFSEPNSKRTSFLTKRANHQYGKMTLYKKAAHSLHEVMKG